MRPQSPRVVAIALVAVMSMPLLPYELFGGSDTAEAQGGALAGLLPQGVNWQDWQATHRLYFQLTGTQPCPQDPQTNTVSVPGDRRCQLPMNTSAPTATVPLRVTRTTVPSGPVGESGVQPQDTQRAWVRLEKALAHPMKVNALSAEVFISFPSLTECGGLTGDSTGLLTVHMEVRALPSGDNGEGSDGQLIGSRVFDTCPRTATQTGPIYSITADIPVSTPFQMLADQKLQFNVFIQRVVPGSWGMEYFAEGAESNLAVSSPDAFQFATWMEDAQRRVTTIFPFPGGPGDRLSAVGFFAFKTVFTHPLDNPPEQSPTPQPTDAKWRMSIVAPDGTLVSLRDKSLIPGETPNEFKDCEDAFSDTTTCLSRTAISTDSPPSARVFRMPDRPLLPGSSPTWNYTQQRITDITHGANGGEFKMLIFGRVLGNAFETRLPDGVRFTVGGFGVRLAPLRVGDAVETLSHTVRAGQPTTFLLNVSNVAARADNFTLSTEFLSCAPSSVPCSGWDVDFSGRDVRGQDVVTLQGFNSSLLKVTLRPPDGAVGANVRLRATSQSSPDQRDQQQLSVQVSDTLARGTGVFLFPDPTFKQLRRGESITFNYTIWNRGTDVDSFGVNCEQGPDLTVNPTTLVRNDDTWNGTIRVAGSTIGCRDINATRVLTTTIPPGDTREAVVTLEASANATAKPTMRVVVKAESQGDASKSDRAVADATLETRRSFRLSILTDGLANPDDPQSLVQASRTLRFGKDDPNQCPSPAANPSQNCPGNAENLLPGAWNSAPVSQQRLDTNFTEFAFYRVTLTNDGDEIGNFNLRLAEIQNITTLAQDCPNDDFNSFTRSKATTQGVSMNDQNGVVLLNRPIYSPITDEGDQNIAKNLRVAPGKSAAFYVRVHHEWNRYNLSVLNAGPLEPDGPVCDSQSRVVVQASAEGFPPQAVTAITQALNRDRDDPIFAKSIVITQGMRQDDGTYDADAAQSCPPVTDPLSGDRVFCKYVRPGQVLGACQCSVSWFFTADKFWSTGDEFRLGALRRVGGLSLTDLVNRGWRFSGPNIVEENLGQSGPGIARNATGDEIRLRVDVTVPANATVNDFASLQLDVGGVRSGASQIFAFHTVGAQKFKLNVTNLAGAAAIEIHPGDRAAINLNISNEGAAVDVYNITVPSTLPQGFTPFFQPNETRVSPSRNKTATVFIQSPSVGQFPQTVTGAIRVASLINQSQFRGETFDEVPFTVVVRPTIADNVALRVDGIETKPINGGGSITFTINVTNPAPNEKQFVVRRLPGQDLVPEFVLGWRDIMGEPCFSIGARSSRQISFTISAPIDALEGTHVTYVLRADEANTACQPLTQNPNFAQALVTATVIGQVGLELQPIEPVKVVPRGGAANLPVRIRNVGTAGDTFVFTANFVNQSQALPPNPWNVEVRTSEGEVVQTLFIDPQTSRIVFVNVSAPLNVPFTGVRSDIDFAVRATQGTAASVRLTAFVQDYDIRVRLSNNTIDAAPGQTLFFTLNMTNAGNGIDTHDILVDIGGLAGFWNVSSEFSAVTLLNGTSKDILITVQVPKSPLPTTGAVIGITVRSRQVEAMRPAAEALGAGSPIVALLNQVPKTGLISVNLFPYASLDVDGDREPEIAVDRNRNPLDGFESFQDPFTAIVPAVSLLSADGDGDGRLDHFVDIDLDGRPERYWDPDDARLTAIGGSVSGAAGSANEAYPDVNNDGTLEFLFDSDADLAVDTWIDPATRRTGEAIERDFDDDGNPEFIIDTNGDGRPDRYFDPDRGPRGLVTNVEPSPDGNPQRFAIDTQGAGRPTKVYDRVTGEVSTASFSSVGAFFADFWYLVLLFLAVAVLAGYLVMQRRKGQGPGGGQP